MKDYVKILKLIFLGFLATSLFGCKQYTLEDEIKARNYCSKFGAEITIMVFEERAIGFRCRAGSDYFYDVPEEVLSKQQ